MHVGRLLDSQCDAEVVVHFGDARGHHDRSTERGERRLDASAHLERKARVGVGVVVVVVVIVRVVVVAEDARDDSPLHSLARAAHACDPEQRREGTVIDPPPPPLRTIGPEEAGW